ncbi:MAG: DUF2723 domain-containing protein [Candidatus Eisenbacteria bacterium]|nr:DUF2723 domain-containing protein [Candidatus Eisenbacteria bacterium]
MSGSQGNPLARLLPTRAADRLSWIGAALVLLITQIVYTQTMTITSPFWDSGEFIATSYILGIPHPPGTPLYVLIGRIFTLFPFFPEIATRVNWLSALASSVAAMFSFLVVAELFRFWRRADVARGGQDTATHVSDHQIQGGDWIGFFGGLVAALFTAFSRTFWDNAIEAEVYSLSSALMMLAVWMVLRWARTSGAHGVRNGWFLLLYYLICLSMGIHLGTFLVLPGIILFMLLWDRSSFGLNIYSALAVAGIVVLLHPGMLPTLGLKVWGPLIVGVLIWSVLRPLIVPGHRSAFGPRGLVSWCAIVAVLGISTHLYLKIRAGHNPGINEGDPETWTALWKMLIRDQYKPANPFSERQAPWTIQFTKHFWDYARDQYSLGIRPTAIAWFAPYLLGLFGLVRHLQREKKTFVMLLVTYLITSVGMVFYLNFKTNEVRERDYFFVASFQFFALWIGLGAAGLLELAFGRDLRAAAADGARRWLLPATGLFLALVPFATMRTHWFYKDRSDFFVARDFAHNILTSLEPNALLFTNGDNDTFPLWYLQLVEKVRTDVRVVNLSLLNTDWYMKQLRDDSPKVDLGWNDLQIADATDFSSFMTAYRMKILDRKEIEGFVQASGLAPYVRSLDLPLLAKDVAVARIIEREYGRRPIYVAMTVPDHMGLERRMILRGVAYQLTDPVGTGSRERVDREAVRTQLLERFTYRGVLKNGRRDDSVYKDPNARRILQNYAAAALRASQEARAAEDWGIANEMSRFALEMAPDIPEVHYSMALNYFAADSLAQAERELRWILDAGEGDAQILRLLARVQEGAGKLDDTEATYREAIRIAPQNFDVVRELFAFLWQGRRERSRALEVLDAWLARNPDDRAVRDARRQYADSLQTAGR